MTILITKQEGIRRFKEEVMPCIRKKEAERNCVDTHYRVEEWSNFVDSLIEEGLVNDNQYRNWCVPRFIEG